MRMMKRKSLNICRLFFTCGLAALVGLIWSHSWIRTNSGSTNWEFYHAEKWIVLTTIAAPTSQIKDLAAIPGWKVVVAGDTKTPRDWSYPNCVYISIENQSTLGFETISLLPERSYARKNAAYLFAIAHGAKVIYETDDDNRPLNFLRNFVLSQTLSGLMYNETQLFNPYRHFGQPTLWPRGYPLSSVGENITTNYLLGNWKTPSIQQGVVNGDPDVDAIFRLTRKKAQFILNVTFDASSPLAVIAPGVFSPFNSQNTLFQYDALWALLIPTTNTFRVCDIWRGYWAQRLLWEIGRNIGFLPPNGFQKRNVHSYLLDAVEEQDLYFQTERLIKVLTVWTCEATYSFFECMISLSHHMAKENFWKERDARLSNAWVSDLRAIGYNEPKRVNLNSLLRARPIMKSVIHEQQNNTDEILRVNFWAAEQIIPSIFTQKKLNPLVSRLTKVSEYCPGFNISKTTLHGNLTIFADILLIVVFNHPHYKNTAFLDALYSSQFPNILYCGSNKTEFKKQTQHLDPLSFLEVDVDRGELSQVCAIGAMNMGYGVKGYLYVADDTLLNVWNLPKLPFDKLWYVKPDILQVSKKSWHFFENNQHGRKVYQEAVASSKKMDKSRFDKFFKLLARNTGKSDGLYHAFPDIAYIPRRLQTDVLYFLQHFTKHNVYVEIAFPTVFHGIEKKEDIYNLPGSYLNSRDRHVFASFFNKDHIFVHPVKISHQLASKEGKLFYCTKYLPLILGLG